MARLEQQIAQSINKAIGQSLSKINQIQLANDIGRAYVEEMRERTSDGKDRSYSKFPSRDSKYLRQKRKIINGTMKGRGGRRSKTVAAFNRQKARIGVSTYAASSAGDWIALTGHTIASMDYKVLDVKFPTYRTQGEIKFLLYMKDPNLTISRGSKAKDKWEGLHRNGYKFFGFTKTSNRLNQRVKRIVDGYL